MVVFTNGRVDSKSYRRFRVRLDTGEANDVAMMGEVLRRRFAPERMADGRFGRGPTSSSSTAASRSSPPRARCSASSGLSDIPVAGLAKREEELFVPWSDEPVVLPDRLAVALPREARARRGAPLRDRVPPRRCAARR